MHIWCCRVRAYDPNITVVYCSDEQNDLPDASGVPGSETDNMSGLCFACIYMMLQFL